MQIILSQDEIVSAIETYVRGQITITDNQEIAIELKAGRGENGFSATLDIRPIQVVVASTSKLKTKVTTVQEGGPLNLPPKTQPAAAASPTKLFGSKTPEPVVEPAPEPETVTAGISTGEDRGEVQQAEPDPTTPDEVTAASEAPVEKAKSIFSFNSAKSA